MSINKLVSIKNPIVDAMDFLHIDNDKQIPWFTNLAIQAEKKIDSYYQYERTHAVLTVEGCCVCLPNDSKLVEVVVVGDLGLDCRNLLTSVCGWAGNNVTNVNSNGLFLVVDIGSSGESYTGWNMVPYHIQNNKLIFDQNFNGDKITIQYLRYKTDCDGFIEVCENHIDAIKWYIIWQYKLSQRMSNYLDRDVMQMAYSEWNRECRHARAEDSRMTQPERQEVVASYNNPQSGIGLWQGMQTTLGNSYFIW